MGIDQRGMLRKLGRQNSFWRLVRSSENAIVALMANDEVPELVLPMRDVWIGGTRQNGIRPTVTLTDRQIIVITYASRWRSAKYVTFNRSDIVHVSDYSGRAFEMTLANGTMLKMRGLIGDDKMPLRLYELLSKE
jgi:hypothetical protein